MLCVGHSKDQHMATSLFAELPPKESPPRFAHERLTVKEVAEYLRVHPWTVYSWARNGRLPCIRLAPHSLRFLKSDIDKYEKAHTSGPIR
jgi:excisionase family DNA binding protein